MTNAVNIAGLGGALTVTSGVVNFSSTPTVNSSPIGASAATPTVLGTVYAKQTTGGGSPYLTAFGSFAATNTTGELNTAVGNNALFTNVSGIRNSAFGTNALYSNTGSYNVAVGMAALQTNTSANENSALGYNAGFSTTTGTENVAIGSSALYSNTTANAHVAVGRRALYANTTGDSNTAVGHSAGKAVTTGSYNAIFGAYAGQNLTTGGRNSIIGEGAGSSVTTANYVTLVGDNAGNVITTGSGNTGIGREALINVIDGSFNVGVGASSGSVLFNGSYNTYLGVCSSFNGSSNNELVCAAGAGAVGKGSNTAFISAVGGSSYNGANSSSWATTSDRRLKKNIVDNNEGLNIVSQIRVRNFEYRTEEEVTELPASAVIKKTGVQLGVIAQELQQVCSDCVKEESTGVLAVDSDNIFWHMVNAIKDLKTLNDTLTARITALEAK